MIEQERKQPWDAYSNQYIFKIVGLQKPSWKYYQYTFFANFWIEQQQDIE